MTRLPPWIRTSLRTDASFPRVHDLLSGLKLHTVCRSARCPNRAECWNRGTATFLILGDTCTRDCRFCAVASGRPSAPDPDEPRRVGEAVRALGLRYVVLTSVTRDDLADGGAAYFAAAIRGVREAAPGAGIEVLTPDFQGLETSADVVLDARPDVFGHNLETVQRLQPAVRPQASYENSLKVLRRAARRRTAAVKSGIMVGMGEREEEVYGAMEDLREAGCECLTVGQYLMPEPGRHPVARFVAPDEFVRYAERAKALGFRHVASAPLVRSSYRAEELLQTA